MSFNRAKLLTSKYGSKDLLEGKDEITIIGVEIPSGYFVQEADESAPEFIIEKQQVVGGYRAILKPLHKPEGLIGAMHNGVYAEVDNYIADHITKMLGYPCPDVIPVFDRFESQESYNILCR